jgi:hypothetical protein
MANITEFLRKPKALSEKIAKELSNPIYWKKRERLNSKARYLAVTATQIALSLGATEQPIGIADPNDHVLARGAFPLPDGTTISVGSNVDDSDAANRRIECDVWTHRGEKTLKSCYLSSAGPGYCGISYNDGVSKHDQWNNKAAKRGAIEMINKLISVGSPIHPD